jgi:hypothetical protein
LLGRNYSAFEGLELYDGKLSRTVLRGRRAVRPLATRCVQRVSILSFTETLKEDGWNEEISTVSFKKGTWVLTFDTSSWIEIGSQNNPRIFDVPVPDKDKENWTLNLIEHLCKTDDKLNSEQ